MSEKSKESKAEAKHVLPEKKPECFVIMPISTPEGYAAKHFDHVFQDIFCPACSIAGYTAVRADQYQTSDLIHLTILQKLLDAPMAICDLSSRNPNVLFELGMRQAFDKPTVLVQQENNGRIFDVDILRIIHYESDLTYRNVMLAQQRVAEAIQATDEAVKEKRSINSLIHLLKLSKPEEYKSGNADMADLVALFNSRFESIQRGLNRLQADQSTPDVLLEMPRANYQQLESRYLHLRKLIMDPATSPETVAEGRDALSRLHREARLAQRRSLDAQELQRFAELELRIRSFHHATEGRPLEE